MRTRLLSIILVLASLLPLAGARADDGGSAYSRYGIGDIQYYTSISDLGLANTGLALLSPLSLTPFNPASWTTVNRARLALSTLYEGYAASDSHGSVYLAGTHFSGIIFALPIVSSSGITLTAGLAPYSRVNYNISMPATEGGFNYTITYLGEGGLTRGHVGLSAMIGSSLSLGAKLDYYFGTLDHNVSQKFAGTSYTTSGVDRSTRMDGIGGSFGAVYTGLREVFGLPQGQSLNVAAVLSTGGKLTAADERYYAYTTTYTSYDTLIDPDGTFNLPMSLAAGVAWQGDRVSVASDFHMQRWTDARLNGDALPFIRDGYRWSAGAEFQPKREQSAPFFQRLTYRGGVYYNATYFRINGTAINEIGFAGGFGASLFSDTRLSFGASYGFRGTTDNQLQKDRILRISLTLNVGELWFVKPPEE